VIGTRGGEGGKISRPAESSLAHRLDLRASLGKEGFPESLQDGKRGKGGTAAYERGIPGVTTLQRDGRLGRVSFYESENLATNRPGKGPENGVEGGRARRVDAR